MDVTCSLEFLEIDQSHGDYSMPFTMPTPVKSPPQFR
jgi:hypothetical protein